jgi:UDP-glucuronate 4-epimerase
MKVLITGTAGFIGFHLAELLNRQGHEILGIDNINDYYDVSLKFSRLKVSGFDPGEIEYGKILSSQSHDDFSFVKLDLSDHENILRISFRK